MQEPATEEPAASEGAAEDGLSAEEAVTEEPITEEPVRELPSPEAPTAKELAAEAIDNAAPETAVEEAAAEATPRTPDAKFPPVASEEAELAAPDETKLTAVTETPPPSASAASCFGNSVGDAESPDPTCTMAASAATIDFPASPSALGIDYAAGGSADVHEAHADEYGDKYGSEDAGYSFHEMMALLNDPDALGSLSPRMLEACSKEGIAPEELLPKTAADFAGDPSSPVPERFRVKRAARYEAHRELKVRDVLECRQTLSRAFSSYDEQAMEALRVELGEVRGCILPLCACAICICMRMCMCMCICMCDGVQRSQPDVLLDGWGAGGNGSCRHQTSPCSAQHRAHLDPPSLSRASHLDPAGSPPPFLPSSPPSSPPSTPS